jgi:hypothetical protein
VASWRWERKGVGVIRGGNGRVDLSGTNPDFDDEGDEFQDVDVRVIRVDIATVILWIRPLAWFVGKAACVKICEC